MDNTNYSDLSVDELVKELNDAMRSIDASHEKISTGRYELMLKCFETRIRDIEKQASVKLDDKMYIEMINMLRYEVVSFKEIFEQIYGTKNA